jgi:hypothetical protein
VLGEGLRDAVGSGSHDRGGEFMKKKAVWMTAMGVAALLVAGGLLASNMGFKLAYLLTTTTPQDLNPIALPWNPQTGLVSAKDLIDDISASTGVTPGSLSFYNNLDGFTSYVPPAPGNFTLTVGKGYLVKVPAGTTYVIVGSDKPGFGVNLTQDTPQDLNFYAHVYHSTASTAKQLLDQIGPNATAISNYNSLDGFTSYVPPAPGNFALKAGEAYLIKVSAPVNGFIPAHY